jgi:hypothetical protein
VHLVDDDDDAIRSAAVAQGYYSEDEAKEAEEVEEPFDLASPANSVEDNRSVVGDDLENIIAETRSVDDIAAEDR